AVLLLAFLNPVFGMPNKPFEWREGKMKRMNGVAFRGISAPASSTPTDPGRRSAVSAVQRNGRTSESTWAAIVSPFETAAEPVSIQERTTIGSTINFPSKQEQLPYHQNAENYGSPGVEGIEFLYIPALAPHRDGFTCDSGEN
ncbi:hypothetical protein, partial [Nocardia sp. 852002-20019_SCH5090214]|uniref:hypothetical protein n=2 Tax=Nocardia sp. 852002-20019_SCH5090214 TaxID=1834087 RepID=UPI001E42ECB2